MNLSFGRPSHNTAQTQYFGSKIAEQFFFTQDCASGSFASSQHKIPMKIYPIILIGLTTLVMTSCDAEQKFNAAEWKQKELDWWMTDTREKMVGDLMESDTLIGLTRVEVIELLGLPESQTETEMTYLIREKFGSDIDPEYISDLQIILDNLGQVKNCEVRKNAN
jgi:hypothetical protein